jgi:hypothetical protein
MISVSWHKVKTQLIQLGTSVTFTPANYFDKAIVVIFFETGTIQDKTWLVFFTRPTANQWCGLTD